MLEARRVRRHEVRVALSAAPSLRPVEPAGPAAARTSSAYAPAPGQTSPSDFFTRPHGRSTAIRQRRVSGRERREHLSTSARGLSSSRAGAQRALSARPYGVGRWRRTRCPHDAYGHGTTTSGTAGRAGTGSSQAPRTTYSPVPVSGSHVHHRPRCHGTPCRAPVGADTAATTGTGSRATVRSARVRRNATRADERAAAVGEAYAAGVRDGAGCVPYRTCRPSRRGSAATAASCQRGEGPRAGRPRLDADREPDQRRATSSGEPATDACVMRPGAR